MRFTALTAIVVGSCLASCDKNTEGPQTETTEQPAQTAEPRDLPAKDTGAMGMMDQLRAGCPMAVEGAGVQVSDTEGGVALTFTTTAGDQGDLRARVESMANMYEAHDMHGGMMWHQMGKHMGSSMGMGHMGEEHMGAKGPMPAATCTVSDIDQGAKLELKPKDPAELESLRQHVRWHQQRMQGGECWMLQKSKAPPPNDTN